MKKISLVVVLMLSSMLFAVDFYPKASRIDKPDPVASPLAEQGGLLKEYLGASPKSLNYLLDNNTMSARVFGAMFESLIEMDSSTLEYDRALAENGRFPMTNWNSHSGWIRRHVGAMASL